MRVVYLNVTGQLGGAERLLICLLQAIRKQRPSWSLSVVAGDEGPLIPALSGLGFPVTVLPMPAILNSLGEASTRSPFALFRALTVAFQYRNRLRRLLKSLQPDIVQSMNFKMHLLAACAPVPGAKLCWHIHDFVSNRSLTSKLLRFFSRAPDFAAAISESVARDFRTVSKAPERIVTILNAVDLDRFSPTGPAHPVSHPSVGLVATFARWKGHNVFLKAIASLPQPVNAYIAGAPLYKTAGSQITLDELNAQIDALGLSGHVTFTGFLESTAPLLRGLDVVVHASTDPEPFGLTIAEAMACGRPVVASMAGGVTEFLTPEVNGLGHQPGDSGELSTAIQRLLSDPLLRANLGSAARATAGTLFDPARMARQFIELYEGHP